MSETGPVKRKRVRINRSEDEWREIIMDYERSGLTQEVFCRDGGMSSSAFSKWRNRLKAKEQVTKNGFIELRPKPSGDTSKIYEIILTNGQVLKLGSSYRSAEVKELLGILKG